jgi:phage tail-like protein
MTDYPQPKFHFQVDWGGARIGFTEVTGLDLETEVIEYREGADPSHSKKTLSGLLKNGKITLKRGVVKHDNDFYKWWNTVALNTVERRDVIVSLLDEAHQPVMVWKVMNAWPSKITSTDLKADGNEIAIETLELAHDGLSIQND